MIVDAKTSNRTDEFSFIALLNLVVGGMSWYLLGYGFSFGFSLDSRLRNKFIGNYTFALHRIREDNHNSTAFGYSWVVSSFMYALVCSVIVSEALHLRATLLAHVTSTAYTMSFLFPVIAHWVWSTDGWLSAIRPLRTVPFGSIGAIDMAGSGVVHLLGASISLGASLLLRKAASPKATSDDERRLLLGSFLRLFASFAFVTGVSTSIFPRVYDSTTVLKDLADRLDYYGLNTMVGTMVGM